LALDAEKQQCKVSASNAGQCLYTGIAERDQAGRIANTLMQEHSFSGWGVRTLAVPEARFNLIFYHNGSIWPHDNALIAAGLARYGFKGSCDPHFWRFVRREFIRRIPSS
jgi:glycogen debranching enzyme